VLFLDSLSVEIINALRLRQMDNSLGETYLPSYFERVPDHKRQELLEKVKHY
jgi:hypothetical protein